MSLESNTQDHAAVLKAAGLTTDEQQLSHLMATFDFDRCVVPGWHDVGGRTAEIDLMRDGPTALQEAMELDAETSIREVMAGRSTAVEGGFRAERLDNGIIRLAFEIAVAEGVER